MLIPIDCPSQQYAWGKVGTSSTVAQLSQAVGNEIDEKAPYAELWVGTHVNGPSKVPETNELLSNFLAKNPSYISTNKEEQEKFANGDLPYLFKILSVATALSIQSHPDKKLAEQLHEERPQVYKDPNHKPEMACAITEFEALCGFLPLKDVLQNFKDVPEFFDLVCETNPEVKDIQSIDDEERQRTGLRVIFSALMKSSSENVTKHLDKLVHRLGSDAVGKEMPNSLALRLAQQYPGDVGVFCAYIMSYRKLQPGQAVFLGANEPHAYLSGDCAEIMACSDNVIRAGLTPKLRDVETLCRSLTYRQPGHSGAEFYPGNLMSGEEVDKNCKLYSPPDPAVTEFQMERITVDKDQVYSLSKSSFGCVILILSGAGTAEYESASNDTTKRAKVDSELQRGKIFFQPAGTLVEIKSKDDLVLFRASLKGATSN